ncbi:hypothetical protein LPTSP2_39260 [Leptospira ellinghausenii]|uniref:Uncharacterized protein n=1 Tax=Leptospira ellinghausenii TaxID=1917822 RepID=A0A2P2DIX6_9LEPT|nr:hypothetical protein [Leptospira ellinghausenii]GBF44623.1 hypothetical protein LPTSP2_39260 [Leptospira ellinghausenii]
MKQIQKFILSIPLLLCSNCLGLAVFTLGNFEVKQDKIWKSNHYCFKKENLFSENEIIDCFGTPSHIELFEKCKVLYFSNGLKWTGLGVYAVFVPIVMPIPISRSYTKAYIISEKVITIVFDNTELNYMYGFINTDNPNHKPYNFGEINGLDRKQIKKIPLNQCLNSNDNLIN